MKSQIKKILGAFGYEVSGTRMTPRHLLQPESRRLLEFDDVICRRLCTHGYDFSFIQIGAYDGISTDPLRKYINRCGWHGVMLEPQPGPASRLRRLYEANPRIVIMEAALDRQPGTRTLYTVEVDQIPEWAGGIASFDRAHILKHDYLIPGIETRVRELTVKCVQFSEVLDKLPSAKLDLLQIDAEGADGYILSYFPFDQIKPAIIQWEAKNMTRGQQEAALELVGGHGYLIARSGPDDMLAVHSEIALSDDRRTI